MADITLAVDLGSTRPRAIYVDNRPESDRKTPGLLLMYPEVTKLPESSINAHEASKYGTTSPENDAWVSIAGSYYAVGSLAKRCFCAEHSLLQMKLDGAIAQILAIVGCIAHRLQIPERVSINLGVVVPWDEFKSAGILESLLRKSAADFTFRGKRYETVLEKFICQPEGGGLFARGRQPSIHGDPRHHNIVVLMIGFRNASLLVFEKGVLNKHRSTTTELGMSQMITRIVKDTSGQTTESVLTALCSAKSLNPIDLQCCYAKIVPSLHQDIREAVASDLVDATRAAKDEYLAILETRILQTLTIHIDEFIINGGTARFFRKELADIIQKNYSPRVINWCKTLEDLVKKTFGSTVVKNNLEWRLCDVYGLFFFIQNRFLP